MRFFDIRIFNMFALILDQQLGENVWANYEIKIWVKENTHRCIVYTSTNYVKELLRLLIHVYISWPILMVQIR